MTIDCRYVILDDKTTKGTTLPNEEDETLTYKDAQTASLYFHNTEEKKFERGERVTLQESDINFLENKMQSRVQRTAERKKINETALPHKRKLIDLKSKRHLEVYGKRAREWQKQTSKNSRVLKRSSTQGLHAAIDNFREKQEERLLAEKIAPMVEKYGENRLWEMNLRRKEQVESRLFKRDRGHLVENNCYMMIDDPQKQIPVVRRPKSSYTNYKPRE